jgi:hypothetical protein
MGHRPRQLLQGAPVPPKSPTAVKPTATRPEPSGKK